MARIDDSSSNPPSSRLEARVNEQLAGASDEMRELVEVFASGIERALGDQLVGVYLYGALTFPESAPQAGDLDYHVLIRSELDDRHRAELTTLHEKLAHEHPLGTELDGYYLLLDDARKRVVPSDQLRPGIADKSWALHRAHIHAGHVITLFGPDPTTIYVQPTRPELDAALQSELTFVQQHLDEHQAYCVMNLCRLIYSYRTGNVVSSKQAAASWAQDKLPDQWHELINAATRVYAKNATADDDRLLERATKEFSSYAEGELAEARPHFGKP